MTDPGYCMYPPAPPTPPSHIPAWKTIPPSQRWDAYRQTAEDLPRLAEAAADVWVADIEATEEFRPAIRPAIAEAEAPPARRWAWILRRR